MAVYCPLLSKVGGSISVMEQKLNTNIPAASLPFLIEIQLSITVKSPVDLPVDTEDERFVYDEVSGRRYHRADLE